MKVIKFETGPVLTNGYLVIDEITKEAIVIDVPLESASQIIESAENESARINSIILTHSHWDHVGDAYELQQITNAKVYIHQLDDYRLTNPNEHSIIMLPFELKKIYADNFLEDGDKIRCGNLEFEVRHTPGHTEGGVSLIEHNERTVFTGDTLFSSSVGRVDLPGGNGKTLIDAISNKLITLPDDFIVFSGHGPATTIGDEKRSNPFLNGISLE